jgi:hypothetical protein
MIGKISSPFGARAHAQHPTCLVGSRLDRRQITAEIGMAGCQCGPACICSRISGARQFCCSVCVLLSSRLKLKYLQKGFSNVVLVAEIWIKGQVQNLVENRTLLVHHGRGIDNLWAVALCKVHLGFEAPHVLPWSFWPRRQTGIIGGHDPELDGDVAPELGAVDRTPLTVLREQHFHFLMTSGAA